MQDNVAAERASIVRQFFPSGIPELWCPLLTHYHTDATVDIARMRAHLRHLAPAVKTFLVPGSTGDGWEMTAQQQRDLVSRLQRIAEDLELWLMIGVLRTGRGEARAEIELAARAFGADDPTSSVQQKAAALARRRICGFTVTPPKGANLTQAEIHAELAQVAELAFPVSFCQLPQITENEMSPETVSALAAAYPNFYLFKDTSGTDRVATSAVDCHNLFLVRGAEEDYAQWHHDAGGPYDGFLLSTVNCFARPLRQMLAALAAGDRTVAVNISQRVSEVARTVFAAAAELPFGNAFSNANRAIDHIFAHGTAVETAPLPLTCSGNQIPARLVDLARQALEQGGFEVSSGYLAQTRG